MRKLLLTLFTLALALSKLNAQYIQSNGLVIYDTSSTSQLLKTVGPAPTPQNGSGSLGQIYNNSACGLNYVQTSVMITNRYSPPGVGLPASLSVSSVPCNSTIEQAYVWWTTSGSGSAGSVTVTNPLGATNVHAAAIVGSGPDKCWASLGTYTYRADVTSSIAGNGNYNINISHGASETDGATLFIIYRDLNSTIRGSLVINDGCIVNNTGGSVTQTMTGINACAGSISGNAFAIASDLQPNAAPNHTTTLNSAVGTYPQTFWNFDSAPTSVFAGQNTATFGLSTSSDCYAFAVMGLYYQTNSCVTCTPSSAMSVTSSQNNVTCAGGNNGSATVSPSGGTGPYSYSWSPFGGNAATATGLSAGSYTVTVSDASGCMTTQTVVTITQPGALSAGQSQTNVSCAGGNNGSATVSPSGGAGGYSYSWSPFGGNGSTATGLTAGNYTATITDASGCSTTSGFTISQPSALSASQSQTNVSCAGGSNGSATVSPSGGAGGYSYSWSPSGGNGSTATGLTAGNYTATITDANGCSTTSGFTISQPSAVTASQSQTNVSCAGGNNGSATVSPSGGAGGYSYSWSPFGGNGSTATGLTAGNYTVTITDASGCSTTSGFTISQPSALSASQSQTNVSCAGGSNGSASVSPSGGAGGYSYSWSPFGGNGSTATGLTAGGYTVTITDASGCTTSSSFSISEPSAISVAMSSTSAGCAVSNGSASASPSGGAGGYSYSWSPSGGNAATATNLSAGTYTVTVTDANGCSTTASTTVTTPPNSLSVQSSQADVSCFGGSTGSATVNVSGGSPGYSYSWSPSGGNAATATGLAAGSYTVTITDAAGCLNQETFVINQPAALAPNAASLDATCNAACDGSLTAQVSGGTGSYSYSWQPGGQSTASVTGLCAGTYTMNITDANGCAASNTFVINQPSAVTASITSVTQASCMGGGSATAAASGGTGSYSYSWSPSGGNAATATNLSAGTYTVTVTDGNNCSTNTTATITAPPSALSVQSAQTDITCNGAGDGTATANVSGGTGPYTYSWSPSGGNAATATGLGPGTYTVTITDAVGCTATSVHTITEPAVLSASITIVDANCNGACNGTATVQTAGGTGSTTVLWTPTGATTAQITGLCAGTYSVTVTDANGCSTSQNGTVSEPAAVTGSVLSTTDVTCNGSNDGAGAVSGSGGLGTLTYSWSPSGGNASTASNLGGGTYTVSITDSVGCSTQVNVTVNEPAALALNISGNTTMCFGDSVLLTANVTGGTAPYTYAWSNGNTNASQYVSPANDTTYTVTVTDANGCPQQQQSIAVSVSPPLVASVSPGDSICAGDSASVFAAAAGGNVPYSYSWSHGLGSGVGPITVAPTTTTTYTVTITDGCGTMFNGTVTVVVNPAPTAAFTAAPDSSWTGEPILFVDASPSATTWSWDFGDGNTSTEQNPVHLYDDAGQFTVTLIASNTYGCYDTLTYSFIHILEALDVPNVFTPNGDGKNDVFNIRASGVEEFTIEIYNRWGIKVFESIAPRIQWDGRTTSGQEASSGTYYYVLYARMESGKVYDTSGHITLLRNE